MKHGSLFSGIGGFDLAAEWMGWDNVFHCEWNPFGQKVLKHYWPNAISYNDITKTDFTIHRVGIDILTGGFPCQPYSLAGKRKGKDDERHLWPEMLRAIREIQPRWVVGENVFGLINWSGGMVFHEVQADLEAEGYEVQPYVLPAVSVNAPHRRDRVWFIAYCNITSTEHPVSTGGDLSTSIFYEDATNPNSNGQHRINSQHEVNTSKGGEYAQRDIVKGLDNGNVANACSSRRVQDNEQYASGESKYACSSWDRFPTQPPICSRNDGFPSRLDGITFPKWRAESIKAYGNAVVPQVVYQIFKAIEAYENKK